MNCTVQMTAILRTASGLKFGITTLLRALMVCVLTRQNAFGTNGFRFYNRRVLSAALPVTLRSVQHPGLHQVTKSLNAKNVDDP